MTTKQLAHTDAQYQAVRLRFRQLIRLVHEQGYTYDEIEVQMLMAHESEMDTEVLSVDQTQR